MPHLGKCKFGIILADQNQIPSHKFLMAGTRKPNMYEISMIHATLRVAKMRKGSGIFGFVAAYKAVCEALAEGFVPCMASCHPSKHEIVYLQKDGESFKEFS